MRSWLVLGIFCFVKHALWADDEREPVLSDVRHATEGAGLQSDVDEFDEEGLYLLNESIPVSLPLTDRSVEGKLKRLSKIRVFVLGTVADLCNTDLCTDKAKGLVQTNKGLQCSELTREDLSENACMDGEYFVVQVVEDPAYTNCFCTKTTNIEANISRIARVETRTILPEAPDDSGVKAEEGEELARAISLFDANSTQFVALDNSGSKVYEGYPHADTVAAVGGKKMQNNFATFIKKYTKMAGGDYVFAPDYSKRYKGMIGGTLYRRLPNSSLEKVNLDFYTSRSNIPVNVVIGNHDDGGDSSKPKSHKSDPVPDEKPEAPPKVVEKKPTPAPNPLPVVGDTDLILNRVQDSKQTEAHKKFVKRFHGAMKSLVYGVSHAESSVLRSGVGSGFADLFNRESSDASKKSTDEKGLCWRYVALGVHKAANVGSPYLPSRPPVADKARDAYSVMKNLTQTCSDGRVIPLFKYVAIPEKYRETKTKKGSTVGISRNTLLIKDKNGLSPFQEFVNSQLQSGDILVWNNPSSKRAGHIEAYFPESRSNGPDDAFFSDYRGDMDQKDGNPDRPGGRSTNTLKHIMRYNSC